MTPSHLLQIKALISSFTIPGMYEDVDSEIEISNVVDPIIVAGILFNRVVLAGEYYSKSAPSVAHDILQAVYGLKAQAVSLSSKSNQQKLDLNSKQANVGRDLFSICIRINEDIEPADRFHFISIEDIISTDRKPYVLDPDFIMKRREFSNIKAKIVLLVSYNDLLDRINQSLSIVEQNLELFNGIIARLQPILLKQASQRTDYSIEFKNFILEHTRHSIEKTRFDNNQSELAISLYKINIALAYIDELYECNEQTKQSLKYYEVFLSEVTGNPVTKALSDLLLEKVRFLVYKVDFRLFKNQANNLLEPAPPKNSPYQPFIDSLLRHYKRDFHQNDILKVISLYCEDGYQDIEIAKVHSLVWYIKKVNFEPIYPRINKIQSIQANLIKVLDSIIGNDFDIVAFRSAIIYCENAVFELILFEEELNNYSGLTQGYEDNISKRKPIVKMNSFLQERYSAATSINFNDNSNFYIFYRLAKFIHNYVLYLIDNSELLFQAMDHFDREEQAEDLLTGINEVVNDIKANAVKVLKDLRLTLAVAKQIELQPLYLSLSECIVDYEWKSKLGYPDELKVGSLFLNSAYILPIDIARVSNDLAVWEGALVSVDLRILEQKLINEQQKLVAKIREKALQLKLKEGEFKSIQIVALFVSVAAFVLSSVKLFDNNNSALENYGILVGFAGGLILFNAGINFLVQWNLHKYRVDLKQIFIGIILFLGIVYSLRVSKSILTTEYDKSLHERDSLEMRIKKLEDLIVD